MNEHGLVDKEIPTTLPDALVGRLASVRSVGAITGAGISRESGIPTYRGQGGIYDDPEEGDRTVEALSGPTLVTDPDRTWRAVAALARQAMDARPGPAHLALAEIEQHADRFVLMTQNVDGLHRQAGSRNIIEIHGNVFATRCMACGLGGSLDRERLAVLEAAPRCAACRGVMRPQAVLFGEMLDPECVRRMYEEFHRNPPDLVMSIGTTALFPYIHEPLVQARRAGKLTVEINPEPTATSDLAEFALRGRAGELLPPIARALR